MWPEDITQESLIWFWIFLKHNIFQPFLLLHLHHLKLLVESNIENYFAMFLNLPQVSQTMGSSVHRYNCRKKWSSFHRTPHKLCSSQCSGTVRLPQICQHSELHAQFVPTIKIIYSSERIISHIIWKGGQVHFRRPVNLSRKFQNLNIARLGHFTKHDDKRTAFHVMLVLDVLSGVTTDFELKLSKGHLV